MMRYLFTCLVLFMIGLTGIHAQSVVPVITSYGRLVVFQKGAFQEVDARKPQALFPSGDRLAYLTDAGDLKLFADGKVTTLQGGEPVQVGMSKYLLAWRTGPSLRIPAAGGSKILCRSVGRFTVSDSIIAFHDQMQQTLSAYWNGRAVPIADVLMTSEDVVWKSGSNTLLLYDLGHRRVLLFYRGRVSVLCNGDDPSRSETGGDMVAYMDEYDDTFRVFNKGDDYEVEPFAPASFQVGNGLVAYVNSSGSFKSFQGGRVWDISDFAPDEYWARDSVVVFREGDLFKVFSGGAVQTLERTMPAQWKVSGGMIAWLDVSGVVQLFHNGERITVSKESGISQFDLFPDAVSFMSNSGATKVWWSGKLYDHY
ncbi:MAG TPA: hypothetical protein PLS92_08820 [Flavobacteriales bacterium]|nr:hypothetical protein [Flavobacteriales bacterium]QQS73022.1 MAG: hypothetical protein IPP95_01985 [Flavobacteriales bacterium]HQV39535.1 hypothetical protein [Flavobacteriales bacterium]HQW32502.1 hypothetical protein [Flavobacteriales bacterium]HQY03085.1 hypothetical protein [Flavobacteriales bacterium]